MVSYNSNNNTVYSIKEKISYFMDKIYHIIDNIFRYIYSQFINVKSTIDSIIIYIYKDLNESKKVGVSSMLNAVNDGKDSTLINNLNSDSFESILCESGNIKNHYGSKIKRTGLIGNFYNKCELYLFKLIQYIYNKIKDKLLFLIKNKTSFNIS